MKVLIIGGTKDTPGQKEREYYQRYLDFFTRSARMTTEKVTIATTLIDDLIIQVGDGTMSIYDTSNQCELTDYNVFFFRGDRFRTYIDALSTINMYANYHNITMINDYSNVRDSSKLLQAIHFETINIPIVKTLNVNTALMNNINHVNDWKFPCIMKAKHGSHGNDNYLVNSIDEVREISKRQSDKSFVLQRFVPNDGDYRILIIGDQTIVIGRSAQEGTHLNNTSKGGLAAEVAIDSLPKEVIEQAHAIAQHFKMTIAGVDVLQDKNTGEFYFLEVNDQPQLISGAFIDTKNHLLGTLLKQLEGTL